MVLEVKGGSVWVDDQGRWRQNNRPHNVIWPVDQARDGKYALRTYVEADPRWRTSSRTRIRWGHMVVVPFTDLADDFTTPDCPRWTISGRGDLDDLAGRIHDLADRQETGHRVPDDGDIDLIREILTGRSLSPTSPRRRMSARPSRTGSHRSRPPCSRWPRLIHRLEVRGGAGSGKTILALTQAKDLTRGQGSASRSGSRCSATRSASRSTSNGSSRGATQTPSRVRRLLRGPRERVGHLDRPRPQRRRLLGAGPGRADGRGGDRATRGEAFRRDHRRRGAGLRRPLVARS